MIRTRVGYAGGRQPDPTYHNIGDHAETLEVDFDAKLCSFSKLLELFWKSHNPCREAWKRQYMSAVFYQNDEQARLVEETAARIAKERGAPVQTEIAKAERFYLAEDYHQKYVLRRHPDLANDLLEVYPDLKGFVDSTAATRLNGYVAGYGELADFEHDWPLLGLSEDALARLRAQFTTASRS